MVPRQKYRPHALRLDVSALSVSRHRVKPSESAPAWIAMRGATRLLQRAATRTLGRTVIARAYVALLLAAFADNSFSQGILANHPLIGRWVWTVSSGWNLESIQGNLTELI